MSRRAAVKGSVLHRPSTQCDMARALLISHSERGVVCVSWVSRVTRRMRAVEKGIIPSEEASVAVAVVVYSVPERVLGMLRMGKGDGGVGDVAVWRWGRRSDGVLLFVVMALFG